MRCAAVFTVLCLMLSQVAGAAETNAAVSYRMAMTLAGAWRGEAERLTNWDEIPIAEARQLAAKGKVALDLVATGAKLKECDWKLEFTGANSADLPLLDGAKLLSLMSNLNARVHVADGKVELALDRVRESVILSRRLRQIPVFTARLIGAASEASGMAAAATWLPSANGTIAKAMATTLVNVPPVPTVQQVIDAETKIVPPAEVAAWRQRLPKVAEITKSTDQMVIVTRAMFQAALHQRFEGDDALAAHDPAGDGNFTVNQWQGGYELISKAVWSGGQVTLTVGKEKPAK